MTPCLRSGVPSSTVLRRAVLCCAALRPLVITSMDRLDIVMSLLAAQLSLTGPHVAGILLTQAGKERPNRAYSK